MFSPGIEVDPERLDQLLAHPRVGQQRPELAVHDRGQQGVVSEQESLDGQVVRVLDPAVTREPHGRAQGLEQASHARGQALDPGGRRREDRGGRRPGRLGQARPELGEPRPGRPCQHDDVTPPREHLRQCHARPCAVPGGPPAEPEADARG